MPDTHKHVQKSPPTPTRCPCPQPLVLGGTGLPAKQQDSASASAGWGSDAAGRGGTFFPPPTLLGARQHLRTSSGSLGPGDGDKDAGGQPTAKRHPPCSGGRKGAWATRTAPGVRVLKRPWGTPPAAGVVALLPPKSPQHSWPHLHFSEATKAKGSGVDIRAGEPFPTAAVSCSQKRREGEGTPSPPPPQSRQESAANERAALTQRWQGQR